MSADLKKKMRELLDEVRDNGWSAAVNNNHVKVRGLETMVVLASTPSDYRSLENSRAELRRAGYLEKNPKEMRNLRGFGVNNAVKIPQSSRTNLRKLLDDLGEVKGPESKKGQKGGARAALVEKLTEVWMREGITPPTSESYFFTMIKNVASGDASFGQEKINLFDMAVNEMLAMRTNGGSPFQSVKDGTLKTFWQCKECKKEFTGQTSLALHMVKSHPELDGLLVHKDPSPITEPDPIDPTTEELIAAGEVTPEPVEEAPLIADEPPFEESDWVYTEEPVTGGLSIAMPFVPLREKLSVQILVELIKAPYITSTRAYELAEGVQKLEEGQGS